MYTEAMNSFVYPSSHRAKLLNIFEGLYIYHIHKNCHRFTYIYIPLTVACAIYSRESSRPSRPPPLRNAVSPGTMRFWEREQ